MIGLLARRPSQTPPAGPVIELVLLGIVLVSTAGLQGRYHGRLSAGFDERTHRLLVQTNWIRVVAWSAAGVIALWMCQRSFA